MLLAIVLLTGSLSDSDGKVAKGRMKKNLNSLCFPCLLICSSPPLLITVLWVCIQWYTCTFKVRIIYPLCFDKVTKWKDN